MVKAHTPINWENEPSYNTPLNAANLNKMDSEIGILDDRIIEQDTIKLDKATAYTMVKDISFNENNGVFTITLLNGSTKTLDTKLEKIAINFKYDYSTQKLIVTLIDGTTQSIDMSALLTQYEFTDSATLDFTTDSSGKVTATIKSGSITEDMLQPNYLAEIKVETEKSAQSMANAKISENNAKQSELNAKASEEQALEYSNNAQPLAQSVTGNNPTATNSTDGSVIYLNNKGYTQQDGTPSPDNPIRIGGLADKGYFDGDLVQGYRSTTTSKPNGNANYITNKNVIECKEGDTLEIMYEVGARLVFQFFNDGTWVEQIGVSSGETVTEYSCTVPSGANQAYFFIQYANITPSTAKNICVTINGMYAVRVKTCGKNLLQNTAESTTINGVTFTVNDDGSVTVSGTATSQTTLRINSKFMLNGSASTPGKQYIISGVDKNASTSTYCIYMSYYNSNNTHTIDEYCTDTIGKKIRTDMLYMYIGLLVKSGVTINTTFYPQLELGDTATDYEPYTETTASIPISSPLYDGDYIEVYADGTGREYRKMQAYKLTSANASLFTISNTYTGSVYSETLLESNGFKYGGLVKCNMLTGVETRANYVYGTTTTVGRALNLWLKDGVAFSDTTELATFFDEHDIVLVGEKATPTSTPLTAEQVAEFRKLQTYKGVTHVTADGEVVMRYYCDNASGDSVSMLQVMVDDITNSINSINNMQYGVIVKSTDLGRFVPVGAGSDKGLLIKSHSQNGPFSFVMVKNDTNATDVLDFYLCNSNKQAISSGMFFAIVRSQQDSTPTVYHVNCSSGYVSIPKSFTKGGAGMNIWVTLIPMNDYEVVDWN